MVSVLCCLSIIYSLNFLLQWNYTRQIIGFLCCRYDLKVECGVKSNRHKSKTPDACFFFADNLVAIDHKNDDVYILAIHEESSSITQWLDDTEEKLLSLNGSVRVALEIQNSHPLTFYSCKAGLAAEKSREQYIEDVKKCLNSDKASYERWYHSNTLLKL